MDSKDQIAAEAAEMIRGLKYPNLEGIIKSAIEKAQVHRCPDCGSWITRPDPYVEYCKDEPQP